MKIKKLTLHRETLAPLTPDQLDRIAGGGDLTGTTGNLTQTFLACPSRGAISCVPPPSLNNGGCTGPNMPGQTVASLLNTCK